MQAQKFDVQEYGAVMALHARQSLYEMALARGFGDDVIFHVMEEYDLSRPELAEIAFRLLDAINDAADALFLAIERRCGGDSSGSLPRLTLVEIAAALVTARERGELARYE